MPSTLPLYYIASGLWFFTAMVTMVTPVEGREWLPYVCIGGALFFLMLARSRRRREEAQMQSSSGDDDES